MRYLLVGNYGVGNAGDESLREYFLHRYPDVELQVLSAFPTQAELPRFPAGPTSFFSFRWLKTVRALIRSDGMVLGGGSLFTDAESSYACFVWLMHILFATVFRRPILLAFQGIGPLRNPLASCAARFAVRRASYISVRDTASAERILSWKKSAEVVQTFDPSIMLLRDKCVYTKSKKSFVLIPRPSSGWTPVVYDRIIKDFHELIANGAELKIISMHPQDPKERKLTESLSRDLRVPVYEAMVMDEVIRHIGNATCVVTERYHGIIAAALCCGIPFVALRLREGDKLDAFARMCGCPSETLHSFRGQILHETDWEYLRGNLVSLCEQNVKLVEQGEKSLKRALESFARR